VCECRLFPNSRLQKYTHTLVRHLAESQSSYVLSQDSDKFENENIKSMNDEIEYWKGKSGNEASQIYDILCVVQDKMEFDVCCG